MSWWRHTGGPPPKSSPSECPPTGEPRLLPAYPILSGNGEEARSAAWKSQILGNVKGSRDRGSDAPKWAPARPPVNEPRGDSVRRNLTSSPRRGRSRLRTLSLSLYSKNARKSFLEGVDIVNSSGPCSSVTGSDYQSLRSDEYLSAPSDIFDSPASSEGKEMSFVTGTSSPHSDAATAIGPLHQGPFSTGSYMHTTSPRETGSSESRLRSSPDGLSGPSVTSASVPVRSLSLPLFCHPASTTTLPVPAGLPLESYRCVCKTPSNNERGEDDQKPLHLQMKALAPQASSTPRGRLTPSSLHVWSRNVGDEEASKLQQQQASGVQIGDSSHYESDVAQGNDGAAEWCGARPSSELDIPSEGQCEANLATAYGPAGTPAIPSNGLSSSGRHRETTINQPDDLQARRGVSLELLRSKSFRPRTQAAYTFESTGCERRTRSWTACSTSSSFDIWLLAPNPVDHLPFMPLTSPEAAEPFRPLVEAQESTKRQDGKFSVPAQGHSGDAHRPDQREAEVLSPDTLGGYPNAGTPRREDSIDNNASASNGGGICASSDGSCSCSCSRSWTSNSCSSRYSSNSSCICSQRSNSMDSLCSRCAGGGSPITRQDNERTQLSAILDGYLSDAASGIPSHSEKVIREGSECRTSTEEESKTLSSIGQLPASETGDMEAGCVVEARREEGGDTKRAGSHVLHIVGPEQKKLLMNRGGTRVDALLLPEHDRPRTTSGPYTDGTQERSHSYPEVFLQGCHILAESVRAVEPAQLSEGDASGEGEGVALASQKQTTEFPAGNVDDTSHPAEELQAGHAASDLECGNIGQRNTQTVELGDNIALLHEGPLPNDRERYGTELGACSPPTSGEGKQKLHGFPLCSTPAQLSTLLLENSSCSATEAPNTAAQHSSTVEANTLQAEELVTEVPGEGRCPCGDTQANKESQGASLASMEHPGALSSSTLCPVGETTEAGEGFQDVSDEPGTLEGAEPRRQVSGGSEARRLCEDTQEDQARGAASPASDVGPDTPLSRSIVLAMDGGEAVENFQDVSNGPGLDSEEPEREASRSSADASPCRHRLEVQAEEGALPGNEEGAGAQHSLSSVPEGAEAEESFQDASDATCIAAEELKHELPSGSERRTSFEGAQEQKAKKSSPLASIAEASESLWSSFFSALAPATNSSSGFQDALNEAVVEAEGPVREKSREESRGSECGASSGDMQDVAAKHTASPVRVAVPGLPSRSHPVLEGADTEERIQEARQPIREVSVGIDCVGACEDTQEGKASRGISVASVSVHATLSLKSVAFVREAAKASGGFENESSGFGWQAEMPSHEVVGCNLGKSSTGDTQENEARSGASPANVEGPCISSTPLPVPEGAAAEHGFQDASDEAEGDDGVLKYGLSGGNADRNSCGGIQDGAEGAVPATPDGPNASLLSGACSGREDSEVSEGFQDAENGCGGEAEERKSEASYDNEGRSSLGDIQEQESNDGSRAASVDEPGSSSSFPPVAEGEETKERFQDASDDAGLKGRQPKREVSGGDEGKSSRGDTEEHCARQGASLVSAEGAGASISSRLVLESADAKECFQDASDEAGEEAGQRMREVSCGNDGRCPCDDTQERQVTKGAGASSVEGSDAAHGLGPLPESAESEGNFQDTSDDAALEAGESKREASHGTEGKMQCGDKQEHQERRDASTASVSGAGGWLWSSFFSGLEPAKISSLGWQASSDEAGGEVEEPKHEVLPAREGRFLRDDTQERQGSAEASLVKVEGSVASLASGPQPPNPPILENAEAEKRFQDASAAVGGEAGEPKHEVSDGSSGRHACDDAGEGTSSVNVERFGASTNFPPVAEGAEAEERFQDASDEAAPGAGQPKRETFGGNEGRPSYGDTQHLQGRETAYPASLEKPVTPLSRSIGLVVDGVETDENFQDMSNGSGLDAEEPKLEASRGSDARRSCGYTEEHQARQDEALNEGNYAHHFGPQVAPKALERASSNDSDSSLRDSPTRRAVHQCLTEDINGYCRTPVAPLHAGETGEVANWYNCASNGPAKDSYTQQKRCRNNLYRSGSLCPSVCSFSEAQVQGTSSKTPQPFYAAHPADRGRQKACRQQRLQQVRSSDESEAPGSQKQPRGDLGCLSRDSGAEVTAASSNRPVGGEVRNRGHGGTLNSDRASRRDADSYSIHKAAEQYYIGSRSSNDEGSSGNSSEGGRTSSVGESSSSSDRSGSRSSCSSCCSNESHYQSSENVPNSVSRDSSVYETWSSCREFSTRAFGGGGNTELPSGTAEGAISSHLPSSASGAVAPNDSAIEVESTALHSPTGTLSQASLRCTKFGEVPTVLPRQVEREAEKPDQRQEVHAGMRMPTPTCSVASALSSQTSAGSQQNPVSSHWPTSACGLAAALSSLAHLVFTSRVRLTSATHHVDAAPRAQQRGAVDESCAVATQEEHSQEEQRYLDAHVGVEGLCGDSQVQHKLGGGESASREPGGDSPRADLGAGCNAKPGVLIEPLKNHLRGTGAGERLPEAQDGGIYRSLEPPDADLALRGCSLPDSNAAENCAAAQKANEGHHKTCGKAVNLSFGSGNETSRKVVQLNIPQLAPTMPHVLGNRDPFLLRHCGSLQLAHHALRLRSDLSSGSEHAKAESRTRTQLRRRSTFNGAFIPTHSDVDRRKCRESFTSGSSGELFEDGLNPPGPCSTENESFESSISAAEVSSSSSGRGNVSQRYSASEGEKHCSVNRTLPSGESRTVQSRKHEGVGKTQSKISHEGSQNNQTGANCGLHAVAAEATTRHLTNDSPASRSFSDTLSDVHFDRRRQTRWVSCGDLEIDYEDAAIHRIQEFASFGKLGRLEFQRERTGTCYSAQPSTPVAHAKSISWDSKPLDMATTNRILESAVELALHRHPQGRGCRKSVDHTRSDKLKMLLGGAGYMEPSEVHRPGAPASATADSLEAHPTPVTYKETMTKRLALHQAALACRMPPHIFCGNFMSASSLWTLQLRRPFACEEGERPLLFRSSSEAFRKEDFGEASLQKEGYSTQEDAFRTGSSGDTLLAPPVEPPKLSSRFTFSPLLDQILDFPFFEFGSSADNGRPAVVQPSGCITARTSQGQASDENSGIQTKTMPKPRRPWACGEPVSVAQEEPRSAIRTYIHRPGCRCPLCLAGWGVAGHSAGTPVERHAETYSSLEAPTPRFQAGLPVVPAAPGGYAAASPMRILSSPLGPYPGYGPGSGSTIRVESPARIRYGVGETITAPVGYFEHQGSKASIPAHSIYPVEGLQTPRVQTVSCNEWPPSQQPQTPERINAHPPASYPLTAEEKQLQENYSHARPACVASPTPHPQPHDPLHNKSPVSAGSSRAVSFDELEKLRAQQEQQQKEAEELKRRQEELEKEQNKQRELLELERQQLKEQRERLEEQRHALEQEKKEMLQAQLLTPPKSRSRGLESSSGAGKSSPERLPVSSTDDAFDLPRNTTARTQHSHPVRHTTSTSNIVRSITGSGFGELQSDVRHGSTTVDADGADEKEVSCTVGGRQQSLQPAAPCARFLSRTASVDTNDEKEPALIPQDDLQTDPSMALSTALDKLSKIRMKLDTLQQQLEVQSQEVASYYSALKAADQVHSSLQQTAADCRVCYGRRHTQMQEVEKRLSVLTAQDLHPCSVDELEELAQELEGTQYKLTVVQAQRAGGAAEESRKKPKQLLPYSSSCLPDPKSSFAIPEEPVARIGPDECVAAQESALQEIKALGDDLEHIKTVHSEYKRAYKRLQGIMTQQVNSYDVDLQRLIAIEKNLEEKLRRLLFLNGDANYAELSDAQMQEYFRIVNLSIRKVYREIALRESGDRRRNEPRTSGGWLE